MESCVCLSCLASGNGRQHWIDRGLLEMDCEEVRAGLSTRKILRLLCGKSQTRALLVRECGCNQRTFISECVLDHSTFDLQREPAVTTSPGAAFFPACLVDFVSGTIPFFQDNVSWK